MLSDLGVASRALGVVVSKPTGSICKLTLVKIGTFEQSGSHITHFRVNPLEPPKISAQSSQPCNLIPFPSIRPDA